MLFRTTLMTLCILATTSSTQSSWAGAPHDFDFEFGRWNAHLKILRHPLAGSHTWVDYVGTFNVRKIWNGRANLAEFTASSSNAHLEGLTLRLYDPHSHHWSIYFANSWTGQLSVPTVGGFKNGRGEFFDREVFNGKPIVVRFVFSDIHPNSFRFVQSFSPDNGKTREDEWIVTYSRTASS